MRPAPLADPNAYAWLRAALFAAWALSAGGYLVYRLGTFNMEWPVYSWIFYAAEVHAQISILLFAIVTWRLSTRTPPPPLNDAVDVLIPTKGEPLIVLEQTIAAAMALHGAKTVWVLDDSARAEVRALTERLGAQYRARGDATYAKAGNLNHGLGQSQAPLIAVLDADFAAEPDMLRRMTGFFADPTCALVQAPQYFSNSGSFQHLPGLGLPPGWNEQSLWFDVIERGRDRLGATAHCGCPAVLRRSALKAIGGFATGTVTEDAHTGVKLQQAGWACVYLPEFVAAGLAPDSATAYMRQRVRWSSGQYSVIAREGVWRGRKLTAGQTLSYWASLHYQTGAARDALFVLAPPLGILFGVLPVYADFAVFLPAFFLQLFLSWAVMTAFSRGVWRLGPALHFDAAILGPHLFALLAAPFGGVKTFAVTPKERGQREDWRFLAVNGGVAALNGIAAGASMAALWGAADVALRGIPLATVAVWSAFAAASHFSVVWKALRRTVVKPA
jgi:cellulose synthase (UDP-forming)